MNINVNQEADADTNVPVQRRNPKGSEIVHINASIPKDIHRKVNQEMHDRGVSRSLVISELLREAFVMREQFPEVENE